MKYRSEIDGLRALAVIPVIFYHLNLELFNGGFVGVDIFFVISGYLITSILLGDLEKNKFNLVKFYERRARRILPMLFFITLLCIPFAWYFMLPSQIKDFSQSIAAVSLFTSNFLFLKESGYFDPSTEIKPLIHTWTLSVEEQFYIIFPLFLISVKNLGRLRIFYFIIIIAILSFILSEIVIHFNKKINFYILPTRAWEILLGSIAAFMIYKREKGGNNFFSLVGLFLVFFSFFFFSEKIPTPSFYTLLPVLGTMLIILYADKDTIVTKILSTKILVSIGLISYSAYLYHQPLIAFSKIILNYQITFIFKLFLVVLTFILSFYSWKYIEKPFRNKNFLDQKKIFLLSFLAIIIFFTLGFSGHYYNKNFEKYWIAKNIKNEKKDLYHKYILDTDYNMYLHMRNNDNKCHHWQENFENELIKIIEECSKTNDKTLLVIGDSHAMNLYNLLTLLDLDKSTIIGVSRGGCAFSHWEKFCDPQKTFNFLRTNYKKFDQIIYTQNGSSLMSEKNYLIFKENLYLLKKITQEKLKFWGPWVQNQFNIKNFLFRDNIEIRKKYLLQYESLDFKLKNLSNLIDVSYFSLFKLFSPLQKKFIKENCFLYRDTNHVSRCGERIFAKYFYNQLQNQINMN